ncbi:L-lactate MFS transporter [Desulfobotulus mexicanus]|uniref:OFA family MFS transporter n=1 Tax=Desulfobotulus mexicanus TaxID=2586642 RepID=A0A5S5MDF0_9BACT|nr:OFA family MFS transporter [Desulfobotulus mexicanus]TYT73655.1 OFA family MFS transporter [Desulfobotulus mexicanus]
MQEKVLFNRWLVVAGACLMQAILGAVYTWSLFNSALVEKFGWDRGDVVFTFSVTMVSFTIAVLVAGRVQDKLKPRNVAIVGGIVAGMGVFLAGQSTSIMGMYLTYGFITGFAMGAVYVVPVATCAKWFPDRRGFVTGLNLAFVGVGGMALKPVIVSLINNVGVSESFAYLGIAYAILIVIGAFFMVQPPAGYVPPGYTPPKEGVAQTGKVTQSAKQYTPSEMMRTPQFYSLTLIYFFGAAAGLMVIAIAANIGMDLVGLTLAQAGNAVVTISLFNALGRFSWGAISDRIGRMQSLALMSAGFVVVMIFMSLVPMNYGTYLIATCVVGFCFGGYLSTTPSVVTDWFGTKNVGNNYGIVFLSYGVAAMFAPRFSVQMGYTTAFMVAAVLCAVGAVLAFTTKPPRQEVTAAERVHVSS